MILVDSNVIIDIAHRDPEWAAWSENALSAALNSEPLAINPIIYGEVSIRYASAEALNEYLDAFLRLELPYEAAFLAGKAFYNYRLRGGARTSVLPDFLIGAHAAVGGMKLLTRDPRRYRTSFPTLQLIAP